LNVQPRLYVVDGFAGWDPKQWSYRLMEVREVKRTKKIFDDAIDAKEIFRDFAYKQGCECPYISRFKKMFK